MALADYKPPSRTIIIGDAPDQIEVTAHPITVQQIISAYMEQPELFESLFTLARDIGDLDVALRTMMMTAPRTIAYFVCEAVHEPGKEEQFLSLPVYEQEKVISTVVELTFGGAGAKNFVARVVSQFQAAACVMEDAMEQAKPQNHSQNGLEVNRSS